MITRGPNDEGDGHDDRHRTVFARHLPGTGLMLLVARGDTGHHCRLDLVAGEGVSETLACWGHSDLLAEDLTGWNWGVWIEDAVAITAHVVAHVRSGLPPDPFDCPLDIDDPSLH